MDVSETKHGSQSTGEEGGMSNIQNPKFGGQETWSMRLWVQEEAVDLTPLFLKKGVSAQKVSRHQKTSTMSQMTPAQLYEFLEAKDYSELQHLLVFSPTNLSTIEDRIQTAIMEYAKGREPEKQVRMMSAVSFWFTYGV